MSDSMDLTAQPFPRLMGLEVTEAKNTAIRRRIVVKPEICTAAHIMHGGAIMAFADTLGAIGAFLNLPEGALTTTIESKTNFIGAAKEGLDGAWGIGAAAVRAAQFGLADADLARGRQTRRRGHTDTTGARLKRSGALFSLFDIRL
jgi:uncharacterized protein (TIGR00369 family)